MRQLGPNGERTAFVPIDTYGRRPGTASIIIASAVAVVALLSATTCGSDAGKGGSSGDTSGAGNARTTFGALPDREAAPNEVSGPSTGARTVPAGENTSGGVTEASTPAPSVSGLLFPRQMEVNLETPDSETVGKLIVDNEGCIRLHRPEESGTGSTLIWPAGYGIEKRGKIYILDGRHRVVARVGDKVRLGGGAVPASLEGTQIVDKQTQRRLLERCPGVYFLVGGVVGAGQ